MNDQTTKDREGFTRVFYKGAGGYCDVAAQEHLFILDHWKKGQAFYAAKDPWGDPIEIKLAEVAAIGLATPAGIARWLADQDIEEQRRRSRELLNGE